VDTCHVFAAGYDIRMAEGLESAIDELSRAVGRAAIRSWHLNDSKGELGSRLDRHQSIGQGRLGKDPFRRLVADPRFRKVPMVVELPPGPSVERSLRLLRRFARA
jgi:deoxyribonuclease-4